MIRFFRFGLVMLLLCVVALLSAVTTMHFAIHGTEVSVPDFRGLAMADAMDVAGFANALQSLKTHSFW